MLLVVPMKEKSENDVDLGTISLLIPSSKAGEEKAREELFAELKSFLDLVAIQHVNSHLRQKTGVSDIVQMSFVRIIENFDQFSGTTSGELKAWIRTIVKNEANSARTFFRSQKRDIDRERSIDALADMRVPIDPQLTPTTQALNAEHKRILHEILNQMSTDDATVIRLRSFESLSFKEVGERMNRSQQAVSQLWYRAILKFEEKMRKRIDGAE